MSDPKQHLSYRIGNTLINSFKNPLKLFILPYLIICDYLAFKKYLKKNPTNVNYNSNSIKKVMIDVNYNSNFKNIQSDQILLENLNQLFISNNLDSVSINKNLNNHYEYFSKNILSIDINNGPLVSIIMSAYNSEKSIGSSIYSILNQTYKNLELIIVDDASEDQTQEIIKKFILKDKRVKFIINKVNVGTYVSRNYALKYAKGDFITMQDADDWSHPQRIEYQINLLLKNKEIMMCTGKRVIFAEDSILKIEKSDYLTAQITTFFRREVLQKLGFFDSVRTSADAEFIYRFLKIYGQNKYINMNLPIYLQFFHSNQLTNDLKNKKKKSNIIKKIFMHNSVRERYRKAYKSYLNETIEIEQLKYEFPDYNRRYEAPSEIIVSKSIILRNLMNIPDKNNSNYVNNRKHLKYYKRVISLSLPYTKNCNSIIDVGSGNVAMLDNFIAKKKISIDLRNPYVAEDVISIKKDFLQYNSDEKFDICLCLQTLEHVKDVKEFSEKLLNISKILIISVPYKWKKGGTKSHIHDPVDENKLFSWFLKNPTYSEIVEEENKDKRIIHIYNQ
jgi:glycosyltransferase involved in cell wall biosynthesis